MKNSVTARIVLSLTFGVLSAWPATSGPRAETRETFDQRIDAELKGLDPEALVLFRQANEARGREDHAKAAELYAEVHRRVPGFNHALRRQCGEEILLRRRDAAVKHCRSAMQSERSPENLAALAAALLAPSLVGTAELPPVRDDRLEALNLATEAASQKTDDVFTQSIYCWSAIASEHFEHLKQCVGRLEAIGSAGLPANYFATIAALAEGRLGDARASAARARELGLPEETYRSLLDNIERAEPLSRRIGRRALIVGGAWIAGLVALLVVAWLLSVATLRATRTAPLTPRGEERGAEAMLRRVYRAVLWLCCAYYYVSIPVVFGVVLLAGGGILWGMLYVGHMPVKLLVIVAVITLATLWAILRSLFVRRRDEDPGPRLDLSRNPRLGSVLQEVAGAIETRNVDAVFITPGTDIAVFERGGLLRQMAGQQKRCLILGAGALEDMKLLPFKAILAHEFGHLRNKDTAGGGFAMAVRRSLLTMAQNIAAGGAAGWFNPAWWFVSGFYRVFLRISQGASRLQEILADRWAAAKYGAAAFEAGLRHVIERSIRFDAHANATLSEVVKSKAQLPNLYRHRPESSPPEADIAKALEEALSRKPSPYDSHPSPQDRFEAVRRMESAGLPPAVSVTEQDALAWSLFESREEIETSMTALVRKNVLALHGVEIPSGSPEANAENTQTQKPMLDSRELEEHYRNLPNEKIERICLYETRHLRPEVLPVLRAEVVRRGLSKELVDAIEIVAHGLSRDEYDAVVAWFRKRPCPLCGRQEDMLNACFEESVRSAGIVLQRTQVAVVGCPSCLMTRLRGPAAASKDPLALEEARKAGPSMALLEYVRANIVLLALERRRTSTAGEAL